jgi:hypothetical protein
MRAKPLRVEVVASFENTTFKLAVPPKLTKRSQLDLFVVYIKISSEASKVLNSTLLVNSVSHRIANLEPPAMESQRRYL